MTAGRGRLRSSRWRELATWLVPAPATPGRPTADAGGDWRGIYRQATSQLVAPSLFAALRAGDALARVPDDVRQALEWLHGLNDTRNQGLRRVLRDTVAILNRADILPMPLKGALALLPDQYPLAFARVIGDLDVAVPADQATQGFDALRAAGYFPAPNLDAARWSAAYHHLLPLFHPSGDGYVELHRDLFGRKPQQAALPLSAVLGRAETADWEGLRIRIPTLADRLLHNALHDQVNDQGFRTDRRSLRQLLEFARLSALPAAADVDWPARLAELKRLGLDDAVGAWLLAAQGLFGQPLPAGVQPSAAARRAEARFWRRIDDPRLDRRLRWWQHMTDQARRLRNLPRRLITPAWYPAKFRAVRQRWFPPPTAEGRETSEPRARW